MCKKHVCLMSLWGVNLVGSIILLIVGALITTIVNNAINSTVGSMLPVNLATMSASDYNTYVNSSITAEYFVWNITNLKAVLTTGAIPVVAQVGPITMQHWTLKANISQDDPNFIKYNAVDTYYVMDAQSQALLNMPMITINPAYMAVMQQVAQKTLLAEYQATFNTSFAGPGIIADRWFPSNLVNTPTSKIPIALDDTNVNIFVVGTIFSSLFPQLQIPAKSALLGGIAPLLLPVYWEVAVTTILTYDFAANTSQLIQQWSTAAGGNINNTYAIKHGVAALSGFELPVPLSISSTQAAALWDPNNPYSFIANMPFWGGLQNTATQGAAINKLMLTFGLSFNDLETIGAWITPLTALTNTAYRTLVLGGINKSLQSYYSATMPAADFTLATWDDLGALQFGSGMFTTWNADASAQKTGAQPGLPTSLTADKNAGPLLAASGLSAPFEFAVVAEALNPTAPPLRLTLANTKILMSVICGVTPFTPSGDATTAAAVFGVLTGWFKSVNANLNQTQLMTFDYKTSLSGLLATPASVNPTVAKLSPLLSALLPVFDQAGFGYALNNYLSKYWSYSLTGTLASLDQDGIGPANTGLFIRKTAGEVLFGYSFLGNWVPGVCANWTTLLPSAYNPTQYYTTYGPALLWNAQIGAQEGLEIGRQTWLRSGRDSLDYSGQLAKYDGTAAFHYNCDYADPASQYQCSTTAGVIASNYEMWGATEVIAGSCGGTGVAPFKEGAANIIPVIKLYVDQMKRSAYIGYSQDIVYKGITMRRYTLHANMSSNAPNPWRNDDVYYNYGTPNGLISISSALGGVPIYASLPNMLGVDPVAASTTVGQQPQLDLHQTMVDIEPLTGKTMSAYKRLQANFRLKASEYTFNGVYAKFFAQASTVYVPYYWAQEHAEIGDSDASSFVSQIYGNRKLATTMQSVLIAAGVIGILLWTGLLIFQYRRNKAENAVNMYTDPSD